MSDILLNQFKNQFPTLQIEYINDSICVKMQKDYWHNLATRDTCNNNELLINKEAIKHTENYVIFKRI